MIAQLETGRWKKAVTRSHFRVAFAAAHRFLPLYLGKLKAHCAQVVEPPLPLPKLRARSSSSWARGVHRGKDGQYYVLYIECMGGPENNKLKRVVSQRNNSRANRRGCYETNKAVGKGRLR